MNDPHASTAENAGGEAVEPKPDLVGHTVLVTGATRGIGRAVAVELAAAGANVAVHGRSSQSVAAIAAVLAARWRFLARE